MDKNIQAYLTELIGTYMLVLVSAGTVCAGFLPDQTSSLVAIALAQGFILALALTATTEVSGGCLNPAITLTFWVFNKLDRSKALWLVGTQLLGATLAGLTLRMMFPETVLRLAHFGTPHLNEAALGGTDVSYFSILASGIGIELVLTFILPFAIYATLLDPRAPNLGGLGAGLAMAALVLTAYPITGVGVNPARWFGAWIWDITLNPGAYKDHVVYWLGPILGALLAGAVYEYLLSPGVDVEALSSESTSSGQSKPKQP